MSVEEVVNKTTIKFKRPLKEKEIRSLMIYLARELSADITYEISYRRELIHNRDKGGLSIKTAGLELTARITSSLFASDSLTSKGHENIEALDSISGFSFNKVPGWEVLEYRPEVRALWSKVRTSVDEYFDRSKWK